MSNARITKEDLEDLRINDRAPRIVRQCLTADEVRETLAQTHHVKTVAELQEARNALTQRICDVLGVTRREVKLPQQHIVMTNAAGVALTAWEYSQRDRVKASVRERGLADFHLSIAPDVQRGVLAAWEAKQR